MLLTTYRLVYGSLSKGTCFESLEDLRTKVSANINYFAGYKFNPDFISRAYHLCLKMPRPTGQHSGYDNFSALLIPDADKETFPNDIYNLLEKNGILGNFIKDKYNPEMPLFVSSIGNFNGKQLINCWPQPSYVYSYELKPKWKKPNEKSPDPLAMFIMNHQRQGM